MQNKKPCLQLPRPLHVSIYALLLTLACMLLNPLSALACGGLFSTGEYTEQAAERLIFTVDPTQVTLYEQIRYTGSPKDFAWVLPVPAVPKVETVPISPFQDLDQQTAPLFHTYEAPSCNLTTGSGSSPLSSRSVNVYSGGTVGPYSYNVIDSSNPQALTHWLTGHHYQIPAEAQTEMQPYTAAHMFFLVMRLQGSAGVQDMTPVKITYASSQQAISIPLRMATPMGKEPLGVLVWIFGTSRYVPQNYQSLQLDYNQVKDNSTSYSNLVNQAVSKVHGHGFVTEYAEPTSDLVTSGPDISSLETNDPVLTGLRQNYQYVTRLYTNISPSQINLDPSFVAQTDLPPVDSIHTVGAPAHPPFLICPPSRWAIVGVMLAAAWLGSILLVAMRRRIHTS